MRSRNRLMFLSMLLMAVLFFAPANRLMADEHKGSDGNAVLTMTLKSSGEEEAVASGAEVTLYLVAEDKNGTHGMEFVLTDDYKASGLDIDGRITQEMIDDLASYTVDKGIAGLVTKTTDENGVVTFDGLPNGIYLVMADKLPQGFTSFEPFMYVLPYYDTESGDWFYDGVAEPKMTYQPPIDVSVRKVWNDDGKDRPSSVTVSLGNEDGEFDKVKLSDDNEWKYTWTGLDANKKWEIKEINVPAEYKDTYSVDGYDFTVTNTKSLIQTGQNNRPIPVMIFAGAFLVSAGIIVKVSGKRKNEQ